MEQYQSSYIGRHAELYDLFYSDKPYEQEAEFIHACLQKYCVTPPERILELACGTGTHAFLLEDRGYEVVATDYSIDMLTQARQKGEVSGSRVDFRLQDMRTLDVSERPFDAVLCLFDSIGYVSTNENISRVLDNVRTHLRENGLFLFEFWHAGAMLRGYDPLRIRRWKVPNGEILRISETSVDYRMQLCHVSYSIYEFDNNGRYRFLQETQSNRFFLIQEMEALLAGSNLTLLRAFNGFSDNETITDQTWHVVGIARALPEKDTTVS